MEENNNSIQEKRERFKLDRKLSFEENIRLLKEWNKERKNEFGMAPRAMSDNWMCLKVMYNGAVIDDYSQAPYNKRGVPMRNVTQRINDLYNGFGVEIERRRIDGTNVKEYFVE